MVSNYSFRRFFKKMVKINYITTDEEVEFLFERLDRRYGNSLDEKEKQSYLLSYCENNCVNRYKSIQNHNYIGTRSLVVDGKLFNRLSQEWTITYPEDGITFL